MGRLFCPETTFQLGTITKDPLLLEAVYFQETMLKKNPQTKVPLRAQRLLPLQMLWGKTLQAVGLVEKSDKFLDPTVLQEVLDLAAEEVLDQAEANLQLWMRNTSSWQFI